MNTKEKVANTNWIVLVLLVLIVGGLAFGIYWWQKQNIVKTENTETPVYTALPVTTNTSNTSTPTSSEVKDETADWKVLNREEYNYQFKYPADWTYIEQQISGTSRVILEFKDSNGNVVMSIESPAPGIGAEGSETVRSEEIKIQNSDKSFKKSIVKFSSTEDGSVEYYAIVHWGSETDKDSGLLTFKMKSENDSAERTLDKILSTFRFLK